MCYHYLFIYYGLYLIFSLLLLSLGALLSLLLVLLLFVFVLYLTDDLNPVLDLNMSDVNPQMTWIRFVEPLPDGGAFVINRVRSNGTSQVWRVNVTGQVIQQVYQCGRCYFNRLGMLLPPITGLLVLHNNLYVIYKNGTLVEIDINNNNTVQVYQVPDVRWMRHYGSLSYHPSVITHHDLLLLADKDKGEIFFFNVTSKNKTAWSPTGGNLPTSVSFMTYNSHLYYVMCYWLNWYHYRVLVYNASLGLYQTLFGFSRYDSTSAIGLPDGSIIISDAGDNRVSLFTIQGKFVRHLLTGSNGLSKPVYMSISLPYLWLVDYRGSGIYRLYRYKLY